MKFRFNPWTLVYFGCGAVAIVAFLTGRVSGGVYIAWIGTIVISNFAGVRQIADHIASNTDAWVEHEILSAVERFERKNSDKEK